MVQKTLVLLMILSFSICRGQSFNGQVDGKSIVIRRRHNNESIKKIESAAIDYIDIYQKYISGIRGQECPMYPSCSNYGLKIFSEKRVATAFVINADRLMRCGHDHHNYSLTLGRNGFKYLDFPAYDNAPLEFYYNRNSYYFAYSEAIDGDSTLLFIQKLINNHYYHEALLEINRVEFHSKVFSVDLFINKVICLKAIGEYEKALFEYENKCPIDYKSNTELSYQIALILYKLQNYDRALQSNSVALESCADSLCKMKIILLNGLLYANKLDWQNSMRSYKSLSVFDSYKQISYSNFQLVEEAIRRKGLSPSVAGALSIIPGLGYAYTGHPQTAVSALMINGLLAYATYTNIRNENYGMAMLTGVFNLSFYIGNIYGSTKSAKRFNEQQRKNIINKLEYNSNL
jgi:putative component of membrane protein insertase Oxa1/YidC/SpoIIIJ protein YidD